MAAFYELRGTVLMSIELWVKMIFLSLIFACGGILVKYGMVPTEGFDAIDFITLRDFLGPLEALLAFFAGLYVAQILDR